MFNVRSGVMLLAILAPVCAQNPTATVTGTVHDATAAVIAGASIELRNEATNDVRAAKSGATGEYTIPNLPAGRYTAAVTQAGFRMVHTAHIELQIEQTLRLDFRLEVGSVAESVEVTASVSLLNTENAAKGDVMQAREIGEMPLNGRDFTDLAFLVPGVAPESQGGQGSGMNINGARADNTNFLIDGFNNQNRKSGFAQARPNLDALQEFKMQTSGFSAEYGRLSGGVMNMVLKSGANQPHGSLFEFLRNDIVDARSFFDQEKTPLRRNQFGGVLSGPVLIPKLYNGRDRTFFLFSWESFRQSTSSTVLTSVPTELQRAGNFSSIGKLTDPLGGNFPGSTIPVSRFSDIARKVAAFYPLPNRAGAFNFISVGSQPNFWDSLLMKFDERISNNDMLSFRFTKSYMRSSSPFNGSDLAQFGKHTLDHEGLMGLTFTHLFSPAVINEARVGLSRSAANELGYNQGHDYAADFGIPGVTTDPQLMGFPAFTVTGLAPLGDKHNMPTRFTVTNIQYADTLSWVKGNHLMKFGADVLRTQHFQAANDNTRGIFKFNGNWTGQSFADFLLGLPNSSARQVGSTMDYLFYTHYSTFAQDDWKISSRLTLNFGVRYEISKPPVEKYGRIANFIPELGKLVMADDRTLQGTDIAFTDMSLVGVAHNLGLPASMMDTHWGDIAPRFGFAWRPFTANRTVLRGGYGIYYGGYQDNPISNLTQVFPFVIAQTVNRKANQPTYLTLANPFPVAANLIGSVTNVTGYEFHDPTPYSQNWNLTLEQEIGKGSALEISYVGSKGTHLGRDYDLNQPYRSAAYAPNFPKPYPALGNIDYYAFYANSIYNAGTVAFRRRFEHGFFYRVNYTYSKSIDEASQFGSNSDGGIGNPQNSRCLRCERGRSDWDRGHFLSMNFSYEAPWRKNLLVRGWQIAGTGRAYSGAPFTPQVSNVNLNLGDASRPDRIAKGTLSNPTLERWFDPTAFPAVGTGSFRFGDSGRSILDGPGFVEMNLSLLKNFYFEQKGSLQFRWEVFNALNHANFNLPNGNVNEATAGAINSVGSGRLMQFGLRYRF